jgi:transposase-like protein
MASEKQYSAEFKLKVARQALEQPKDKIDDIARKFDLPVSLVITWATQLDKNGPDSFDLGESKTASSDSDHEPIGDHEKVAVEIANEDIAESIGYGVMKDRLNYRRLIFWSVLGTILFVIFVRALVEMFQYNSQISRARILEESEYFDITEMKQNARETLNSFRVVDLENNIYSIPIDSAINKLAVDSE